MHNNKSKPVRGERESRIFVERARRNYYLNPDQSLEALKKAKDEREALLDLLECHLAS